MTTKQTKDFNAATAELEAVREQIASAQSDVEAAQKKVSEAQQKVEEARAVVAAAEAVRSEAQTKLAELKPYEELALKKTRKFLDAALPGVVQTTVKHEHYVHPDHILERLREEFIPLGYDPRFCSSHYLTR